MTEVGAGGVVISQIEPYKTFLRDYKKLTPDLKKIADNKIRDLYKKPFPPGLRFEKLGSVLI